MKCVICQSVEVFPQWVDELIHVDNDIVLLPIRTLVCANCGERYYDQRTMQTIEATRARLRQHQMSGQVQEVGRS